jgi:hypothetical protein
MKLTSSQGILEDLLETQELEDGQVDGRVETKTSLVGAESGVELDTVSTVDLHVAVVVLPDNTELDHTLGDGNDGKGGLQLGRDLKELGGLEGGDQLWMDVSQLRLYQLSGGGARTVVGLLELGLTGEVRHCGLFFVNCWEARVVCRVKSTD